MLDLRDGTELVLRIRQDEGGFALSVVKEVGSRAKVLSTKRVATEPDLWLAIARWGDKRLAQLGLEQAEQSRNPKSGGPVNSGGG